MIRTAETKDSEDGEGSEDAEGSRKAQVLTQRMGGGSVSRRGAKAVRRWAVVVRPVMAGVMKETGIDAAVQLLEMSKDGSPSGQW